MSERQQNSTTYPVQFLMVRDDDHVTGKTGLAPTVTLSKNGAAFGAAAGAVTEIASGLYSLAANATDRNTLGQCVLHATGTGADPVDYEFQIVEHDPFTKLVIGWEAAYDPSGDNFYVMVWLEDQGTRYQLTAGATCAVAVRESQAVPDLFTTSPTLNLTTDSFEGSKNAPGFAANRVDEIRFTIVNNGVTYTAVGAFPVVSSA